MPKEKVTISYEDNFDVTMPKINFNGFYLAFVRIWLKREDDHLSLTPSNSIQEIATAF